MNKSLVNKILIGIIVIMLVLLAVQVYNMKQVEKDLENDPSLNPTTTPDANASVTLSTDLFDCATVLLDFSDITLKLEDSAIKDYYNELTDDLSNFVPVYDMTFIPADCIFELKYKETSCSIYFYNEIKDDRVYCTVVCENDIIGNYAVPSVYYGNLFNIIYSSDDVTTYTEELLLKEIPRLIEQHDTVEICLDENHKLTKNDTSLASFEGKVKNKEFTTMMYSLNDESYVVICYWNYKYYVFVTDKDGNVLQQENYKHYSLLENDYLYCYNISQSPTSTNFMMDSDCMALKVVVGQ